MPFSSSCSFRPELLYAREAPHLGTVPRATQFRTLRRTRPSEASSGFVYAVSRLGVTGARSTVAPGAAELVARLRAQMGMGGAAVLPIALGFGLARAEQVREVGRFVQGAVVGTALVEAIAHAGAGQKPAAAANFLRSLRNGSE